MRTPPPDNLIHVHQLLADVTELHLGSDHAGNERLDGAPAAQSRLKATESPAAMRVFGSLKQLTRRLRSQLLVTKTKLV